jgi:hypothetical protein
MARSEQRILVTQAAAGMVLARPVTTPSQVVLLGEGATLTDALIAQLLQRGIKRIAVRGSPIAARSQAEWTEQLRLLSERFSRTHHDPFMRALQDVVARVLARRG